MIKNHFEAPLKIITISCIQSEYAFNNRSINMATRFSFNICIKSTITYEFLIYTKNMLLTN